MAPKLFPYPRDTFLALKVGLIGAKNSSISSKRRIEPLFGACFDLANNSLNYYEIKWGELRTPPNSIVKGKTKCDMFLFLLQSSQHTLRFAQTRNKVCSWRRVREENEYIQRQIGIYTSGSHLLS